MEVKSVPAFARGSLPTWGISCVLVTVTVRRWWSGEGQRDRLTALFILLVPGVAVVSSALVIALSSHGWPLGGVVGSLQSEPVAQLSHSSDCDFWLEEHSCFLGLSEDCCLLLVVFPPWNSF